MPSQLKKLYGDKYITVSDELRKMAYFKVKSQHFPGGSEKTHISQDNQMNPPKYKAQVLTTCL